MGNIIKVGYLGDKGLLYADDWDELIDPNTLPISDRLKDKLTSAFIVCKAGYEMAGELDSYSIEISQCNASFIYDTVNEVIDDVVNMLSDELPDYIAVLKY